MSSEIATRRAFLKSSAVVATAASANRVLGANDRIRLAAIGAGPRGQSLMKDLNRIGGVEWVAACDVYSARVDQAATIAGGAVKTFKDHRRVLDLTDIDAVIVATPDHWHAPITIDACEAGKDVYVEKPMVHNPKDGEAVVKAVRANQRVVAVGMQARAVPHWQEARRNFVESGALGKVGLVRTWYNSNGGYTLQAPPGMEQKPDGLDWERWCGPGPKVPWNPEIYFSPYKWLHYDGGMIMGIAIHVVDSAHQFLGLTRPRAAVAGGGVYQFRDGRDTPDVINLVLEYPQDVNVTFEGEILTVGLRPSSDAGIELRGTGGVLRVNRYDRSVGYNYTPHPKNSSTPPASAPGNPSSAEWLLAHWLECIRSRRRPVSDEEAGYYSSVACYMGLEAYRTKSRVTWRDKWDLPA
jgi:predicted dehydrogenase